MKYSNGRFGFSIQKQIWHDCNKQVSDSMQKTFYERVGWYTSNGWLQYYQLKSDISAPEGHLPGFGILWGELGVFYSLWYVLRGQASLTVAGGLDFVSSLAQKLETCGISIPVPDFLSNELSSEPFEATYYANLQSLLKAGKWKEADRETSQVMLKVAQREGANYLKIDDIDNFPCEDFQVIDSLWRHYSDGKFGFSIQKQIWQECGSPKKFGIDWESFGDRVGWRVDGEWIDDYDKVSFNASAAVGHLPSFPHVEDPDGELKVLITLSYLFPRIADCNL